MASLLLVHDDEGLKGVTARYLEMQGNQVVVAGNGSEGLRLVSDLAVDLIIVGNLSDMPCDEFCRWLRATPEREKIPVLFIVPRSTIKVQGMLPAGCRDNLDGVIARPFQLGDLAVAVQRLLAARESHDERKKNLLQMGGLTLDLETQEVVADGSSIALTPIEFRLLRYLMEKAGSVVSKDELLENVWGFYPGTGSAEVVRTHIRNLRAKLASVHGQEEFIQTLPWRGYRIIP